jgi:transcriptional antiterminator RfaH
VSTDPQPAAVGSGTLISPRWYCVRTKPKHERIASAHLRRYANLEVFAPAIQFYRARHKGRKTRVTEALFPGYFFARFDWRTRVREVNSSPGVAGIVRFGDQVPVVPDSILATLRASLGDDERSPSPPSQFRGRR